MQNSRALWILFQDKDRLLMAKTQLLPLSPGPWPLITPSGFPQASLTPGPREQPGGEGVNQGSRGEGTGLCLAACQTLFSGGWREKGRVGEEEPLACQELKPGGWVFWRGSSSASESLPSVEAGTSRRTASAGRLWVCGARTGLPDHQARRGPGSRSSSGGSLQSLGGGGTQRGGESGASHHAFPGPTPVTVPVGGG